MSVRQGRWVWGKETLGGFESVLLASVRNLSGLSI